MSKRKDGKIWIDGLETQFTGQSLSSLDLIESESRHPTVPVLPDLWVVKVGGQSVMDRGAVAVKPILEELVAARKSGKQLLVGTGGGTRARHAYAVGLDLGLPTAMLAKVGCSVPVQNARMLQMLTAKDGGIMCYTDDFEKLPLYLSLGILPIMSGMPPFEFWEKAPKVGRIPANHVEALPELLGVVMIVPSYAEAYLVSGRINLRRSDQEAAIAALKTAIFWDPKLFVAHMLVGKIFLDRGDRGEARKYALSAITIDPNNQEAIALQRQVTMGN